LAGGENPGQRLAIEVAQLDFDPGRRLAGLIAKRQCTAFRKDLVIAGAAQREGRARLVGLAVQSQLALAGGILPLITHLAAARQLDPVKALVKTANTGHGCTAALQTGPFSAALQREGRA